MVSHWLLQVNNFFKENNMRTFKFILVLAIIIACCVIFKAPLFITIGLAGLIFFANSFVSRKKGGMDNRYKFGWMSFIIGIILLIISAIIYSSLG